MALNKRAYHHDDESAGKVDAMDIEAAEDVEDEPLIVEIKSTGKDEVKHVKGPVGGISSIGLKVLILLALQNCSKNLLVRFVMSDAPKFLLSAAVIGSELTKLSLSLLYILLIDRKPLKSVFYFLKEDRKNTLLMAVPATVYNLQQTLEFIALKNIDASVFSVLVQSKLVTTAFFSVALLSKTLRKSQVISLLLLTVGVVLCNIKEKSSSSAEAVDGDSHYSNVMIGTMATLGIAFASGFAAVYTEKVIKKQRNPAIEAKNYSLAYLQVQLALMSLITMGTWAVIKDHAAILENGLWQNYTVPTFICTLSSGIGGLMVAAVLKYTDSVLKGYATAVSVVLTGTMSKFLFGTHLSIMYWLGVVNVICSVLLYNARDLDEILIGGW